VPNREPFLEPSHWLDFVGQAMRAAHLRHALIGGHAVIAWSLPRQTDDYDFIVAAASAAIGQVRASLEAQGLQISKLQNPGAASGPDFLQLRTENNAFQIDLQTAKTEYQDLIIERAVVDSRYGISVASPEDLIVLKLLAMRSQDQRDIAILLEGLMDELDWAYIEHWAAVWDVTDKLRVFRPAPG
jgi:Nucleotidyltransferase of unknown function (DUF6036)